MKRQILFLTELTSQEDSTDANLSLKKPKPMKNASKRKKDIGEKISQLYDALALSLGTVVNERNLVNLVWLPISDIALSHVSCLTYLLDAIAACANTTFTIFVNVIGRNLYMDGYLFLRLAVRQGPPALVKHT